MSRVGQAIGLMLLIAIVAPIPAARAGDSSLINDDGDYWVVRRKKTEPNSHTDIAYVVSVKDLSGTLVAKLWAYNSVDQNDKYVLRTSLTLVEDATHTGRGTLFKYVQGNTEHYLGVVVNRRKKKNGNGKWVYKPKHFNRVVMRYTLKVTNAIPELINCPEVPPDDVLEEEPMADPNTTPPEYPDIP